MWLAGAAACFAEPIAHNIVILLFFSAANYCLLRSARWHIYCGNL
jgi:hypothetical protein